MHPAVLIEFMFVGVVIVTIIIITIFLRSKWRKIGWLLASTVFVVYCLFYIVRPFWIDAQINTKVKLLRPYLEEHYPDERWSITTVPHRKTGMGHLNPYYIGVIFETEPETTYHYWVENRTRIYQISFTTNSSFEELQHLERKDKLPSPR